MLSVIESMRHVHSTKKSTTDIPLIDQRFAGSMIFSYYASQLEFDCFLQIAWLRQNEHVVLHLKISG